MRVCPCFPASFVMQRLGTSTKRLPAPLDKARKLPKPNKIRQDCEEHGPGGGSSSQTETPGGGRDPPESDGRGNIIWQFVNWSDKWGVCTWQDFLPEWSDNVEQIFVEAATSPGGFEKNAPQLNVPDNVWTGSKKNKKTTLYTYDFAIMKQTNEKTGTVRDIRRLAVLRSA